MPESIASATSSPLARVACREVGHQAVVGARGKFDRLAFAVEPLHGSDRAEDLL